MASSTSSARGARELGSAGALLDAALQGPCTMHSREQCQWADLLAMTHTDRSVVPVTFLLHRCLKQTVQWPSALKYVPWWKAAELELPAHCLLFVTPASGSEIRAEVGQRLAYFAIFVRFVCATLRPAASRQLDGREACHVKCCDLHECSAQW